MALAVQARIAWQMLDGQAVLIDLDRGVALGLNPSASWLWARLAGSDAGTLAGGLAETFGLPLDEARRDVEDFLALLRERGYVSG